VADVLQWQVLEEFVRDSDGFPRARRPNTQHLRRGIGQVGHTEDKHTEGAAASSVWEASHPPKGVV
jgi:hypothetical protein